MRFTVILPLLTALSCTACDAADLAPVEPTEPSAAASREIYYEGQRFTLDELGEAPPHVVVVPGGEIHGFDTLAEANDFVRRYEGPAELSAAPRPAAAQIVNCYWDIWFVGLGKLYAPGSVWYLGDNGWNDVISSVENFTSYTVQFYEHAGFGGNTFTLIPGAAFGDLRPYWNDRFSSYKTCPC